jgi:hypothetical protein
MNCLNFFKTRTDDFQIQRDIIEFEKNTGIILPPILKIFFFNYDTVTSSRIEDLLKVYDSKLDTDFSFVSSYFLLDPDNILFYNFFKLKDIKEVMEKVYSKDDEIWQKEMIPIGECAFQMYLMVGYGNENKDRIYIESVTEDVRIRYLCENIFDFFRNYIVEIDENCLPDGVQIDQLYKNWSEDFWRVRDLKE